VNADRHSFPDQGRPATVPATVVQIPTAELLGLLAAAGLQPAAPSPLAGLQVEPVDPGGDSRRILLDAGWLTGIDEPRLTGTGRSVLALLAEPRRRTDLVTGTAAWWFTRTGLAGDEQDGPVLSVAHTGDDDRLALSYPHPPGQAVDLLAKHLRIGYIASALPLAVELSDHAFATWLGVLDDRVEAHLRAALDRTPVTRLAFGVDDVLMALAEGRTSGHLAWQVPVTVMLWPDLDSGLNRNAVRDGLEELAQTGLVASTTRDSYELSEFGRPLVDGLVPIARWASFIHTRREQPTGALTTERLAIRRGIGVTLVEHRPLTGGTTALRSVGDIDLESLIAELSSSTRSGAPAHTPPTCIACRAVLHDGAQFCHECGAPVDAGGAP